MAELNYLKELTLNFNLRKPTSKRPTNVYAVVKVCGKQMKIPTTAKINAYLWDSKKQVPMLLDSMSEVERDNAKQVLSIIFSFQSAFSEYYCYICQNFRIISQKDVRDYFEKTVLSELNVKKMAKNGVPNVKRERKATKALLKALDLYQSVGDKPVTDSTIQTYKFNLQNFIDYCADTKRDSVQMLTDKGINDFEIYLRGKGKSASNIRNSLRIVRILINEVMVKHPDFKLYGVKKVDVKLPKNVRSEGKKVELTEDEIRAIEICDGLTPPQMEYRDLFVLECLTGQRASDIPILFNPTRYTINKNYFSFVTKKEGVPALVERTPEVLSIIERYKDGFKHIDVESEILAKNETIALKEIAKKANLNRMITYSDSKGKIQSKPLSMIISSHYGRHTFVTRMARIVPLETLKFLTGHKDTQALQKYYLHQTEDDRVNLVTKALKGNNCNEEDGIVKQNSNNILNSLFAYDMLLNIEHAMKNDINFNTDSTRQAVETIKNIVGLSTYPKDINKEKVAALDNVVFELSYYYRDVQLYSAYQYKEQYFGIIDKVASYDEINLMFANEDIERPIQQLESDIEEYEQYLKGENGES
jgi:integrase